MQAFAQDIRYALRSLKRAPGFTALMLLTLSLGIGPSTAIFSLLYGVLLRPLPFREPDRLVQARWLFERDTANAVSAVEYFYLKRLPRVFSGVGAMSEASAGLNVVAGGQPVYMRGQYVSADLFGLLGIGPVLGRGFRPEEDAEGGPHAVVISYGLWQSQLGGDPQVLNRFLQVNRVSYPIVGVMPKTFQLGGTVAQLWLPLRLRADPRDQGHNTVVIARLAPGVTIQSAQSEMPLIMASLRAETPGHVGDKERGVLLRPYRSVLVGNTRSTLFLLAGAVALVTIIGTANATGLSLARAAARRHEIGLRAALGAGRWQLVRPFLIESLFLSCGGGAAGLVLGSWALQVLLATAPSALPMANSVRLDLPVLLGALGLAVVAGVVIAVGLGTQSGRAGLQEALRAADRAVSRVTKRGRFALIAAEVGLSLVLLVGAALLIVTLRNLWKVSPGFEAKGRWTLQISLPVAEHSGTEEIWRLESAISRRLEDIPGVTNVATTSSLPLERGLNDWVTAERGGERVQVSVERRLVGLPYFAAMGIPIVRGRSFLPGDSRSAPAVVIVNAALSKATWPQQNPVGKVVRIDGAAARVVGVAGDVREWGLDAAPPAIVYQPQAQASDDMTRAVAGWFPTAWIIKAERPPSFDEVRRAVAAVDVAQPIVNFRPMEDTLRAWLGRWRFVATLLETFAALALLLASVAVYSVVSYAVAHRRREIGLRMAIGATRSSVLKLIFAQGMRPALVGTGVGIAASLILTRTLSSLLFGVEPADPVVLGGAALILLLVASLACLAPSWLAMRLDPADALRSV